MKLSMCTAFTPGLGPTVPTWVVCVPGPQVQLAIGMTTTLLTAIDPCPCLSITEIDSRMESYVCVSDEVLSD